MALVQRVSKRFMTSCMRGAASLTPCIHQQRRFLHPKPKVLVLAGPTAVGKSTVALEIAKFLDGEIISADSIQVYKGLDIGSAKPTASQLEVVRHHLIDIHPFDKQYNAGLFAQHAHEAILGAIDRGKVPIVVGGTAFYLNQLMRYDAGVTPPPPSDAETTAHVQEMIDDLSWDEAFQLLVDADPVYADTVIVNDWRRLTRSLGIIKFTGRTVSSFDINLAGNPQLEFRCVYLTAPRLDLYTRIDQRVEEFLSNGLVEETIDLMRNGLKLGMPAAEAIGYRETIEYIASAWDPRVTRSKQSQRKSFLRLMERIQASTRQFAAKQMSWFRNKEPNYWWLVRDYEYDSSEDVAGWIRDKFVQDEWVLPTRELHRQRAEIDRASVIDADMTSYQSTNLIFQEPKGKDTDPHTENIRNKLKVMFPDRLDLADEEPEAPTPQRTSRGRRYEREIEEHEERKKRSARKGSRGHSARSF